MEEPYRYHGVLASAMSSSMKPRARSGARARLLVLRPDGVGVGSPSADSARRGGRVDNTAVRMDNTSARPGDKSANTQCRIVICETGNEEGVMFVMVYAVAASRRFASAAGLV